MELSIREAAAASGRGERALRAAVRRGSIPAVKRGGRWYILREALLGDPDERERARRKADRARAAVEGALPRSATPRVDDLAPFAVAVRVHALLADAADPRATAALTRGLLALAEGHHAWRPEAKVSAWRRARRPVTQRAGGEPPGRGA